jgi:methanogenic corrinoid protein MtbC1
MTLEELGKLVEDGETEEAQELADKLLKEGTSPLEMISAMTATMARLGDQFAKLEIFLPEIMLAGEALTGVVEVMSPYLEAAGGQEVRGKNRYWCGQG